MKPHRSTNEQFKKDLATGSEFEKKVFTYYQTIENPEWPEEEDRSCDFYLKGTNLLTGVEVKCDKRSLSTGNLAFESYYRGQDSGIMLDSHSIWVHGYGDKEIFIFKQPYLRNKVLDLHRDGKVRFMKYLGDGSSGYLVPVKVVEEEIEHERVKL